MRHTGDNEREAGNAGGAAAVSFRPARGGALSQRCCNLSRLPQKSRCWVICVFRSTLNATPVSSAERRRCRHPLTAAAALLEGSGSAGRLCNVSNTIKHVGAGWFAHEASDPPVRSLGSSLIWWSVGVYLWSSTHPREVNQQPSGLMPQHALISVCFSCNSPPPPLPHILHS